MSSDAAKRSREEINGAKQAFALDDLDDFTPVDATHPLSFMSWNANGLLNRVRGGKRDPPGRVPRAAQALNEAIIRCKPDAIALQEVWLKASGGPTKNNQSRKWNHSQLGDEGKQYAEDKAFVEAMLRRGPLRNYEAHWCLAPAKKSGVAVLVKKGLKKPIRVSRTLAIDGSTETPDDIDTNEGRVLALEYERFIFLNTYVPHNGSNEERWAKRRKWDEKLQKYLKHHEGKKPVVWCGDLNVAHRDIDVGPDPNTFLMVGGFTIPERTRFTRILEHTGMTDVYRAVHGDRQTFTWRSVSGGSYGGYDRWAGMRLDYFVVPQTFMHRVKSVRVATDRFDEQTARSMPMSCFFGSDHCSLFLDLHEFSSQGESEDERVQKQQKTSTAVENSTPPEVITIE